MTTSLTIEGELTVFTAHEIKTRLLGALSPKGTLTLDLSMVSEFDGAGLQLLLAARHEAQQQGCALRMASPSAQIKAVLQLVGLSHDVETSENTILEVAP